MATSAVPASGAISFYGRTGDIDTLDLMPQEQATRREYKMWGDWVYRDPDASLTILDVEREVTALRRGWLRALP